MENVVNDCCTNDLCVNRDTQLRFARLREDLLNNFNSLLIDRIRFLEQTLSQLSLQSSTTSVPFTDKRPPPEIIISDRLIVPTNLRRSTSATADLPQLSDDSILVEDDTNVRSRPPTVKLSASNEKQKGHLSLTASFGMKEQIFFGSSSDYLSPPNIDRPWSRSTNDIPSSSSLNSDKGRLDSRRFACDVDDNDVRAFKAMVYMEQARKQHVRPFTRLRQVLGISTSKSAGNFAMYSPKK
ncbi:unnamed protein product [Adineta ricciae]|uniref:Uncharacterized protein n=1 Tax=Adineta ricciae TaxID=249248 RepID=A0A814P6V9_ADIRI|nr:unnamed protein product [Adineta ricciae]CAF1458289.1 unnamed protein product [Adineta ricciae]